MAVKDISPNDFAIIPLKEKVVYSDDPTENLMSSYGGWSAESDALTNGNVRFESTNERVLIGSATAPMTGTGIFIGKDGTDYEFRAGDPAGQYMHWDGSALTVSGITLTGGTIKYGKTSFADSTNAGYYLGTEGWYVGSASDVTKLKYTLGDGSLDFVGSHSGGTVGGQTVSNVATVSTSTADAVPTGLTCSSTDISTGSDGSQSAYVILTWTAIATTTFDHYLIRYKKASFTYYTYIPSTTNTITIEGLTPNISYNFGISSVNKYGSQSAFSSDIAQTTASDTVAPATTTGLTATAGIQYSLLTWTHNTESDLASYNIYRNTSNSSATATLIGNCRTNYFIDGNRTGGTLVYYWIKAVDTSGNLSASFSTVASCTPRNVASADSNIAHQGWTQTCVFTSTDTDTVSWAAGTFTASNGTSYSIGAGNTGNMSALTYIYLDIAVSTTAYQITTTATTAVGDGKVLIGVAQNHTGEAVFQIFGGMGGIYLDGANLVSGTVTTNEIAANTIVAGNIQAGTITATEIDTTTITSLSNLNIAASQVLISGTTYLSNWAHGTGVTKIDGGEIYTGTVTTTQLNFTPVETGNVIASINSSAEGITIDADNLTINSATTFAAGYDPTSKITTFAQDAIPTSIAVGDIWIDTNDDNKTYRSASAGADEIKAGEWILLETTKVKTFAQDSVPTSLNIGDIWIDTNDGNKMYRATNAGDDEIKAGEWVAVPDANKLDILGGSYDTASSGARVRIFPDANTGIQIIDDATNDVFKAIVGGTDVGDVIIGNYSGGQGIKYDKSTNTTDFQGSMTAGSIDATSVTINGVVLSSVGAFGGDGTDGALSISSGTTTIDLGSATVVTKNYTSISITGTGKLAFSNPNDNGTAIILKSQGNVTLTSSTAPMIDASSMGAIGHTWTLGASANTDGTAGTDGNCFGIIPVTNKGGGGANGASAGSGGAAATIAYSTLQKQLFGKYPQAFVGAGGGTGSGYTGVGSTATATSGRGGGFLAIECAGAWNFTTASGISVAGGTGTSSFTGTDYGVAGPGSGGGGYFIGLYNTLTANTGTVVSSGGTAVTEIHGLSGIGAHKGGGGGGTYLAGSGGSNANGGAGAAGIALVEQNIRFA